MLDKIKALAKAKGVNIMDIEKECGIGQRSMYNWDTNVPAVDKVKAVADYFGVTIDELMRGDDTND